MVNKEETKHVLAVIKDKSKQLEVGELLNFDSVGNLLWNKTWGEKDGFGTGIALDDGVLNAVTRSRF